MRNMVKPVLQDPIISQREPFQLYLLVFGIITGFAVLRDTTVSSVMQDGVVPDLVLRLWGLFVFVGSLVALIGCVFPRRRTSWLLFGLQLERLGLTLLSAACLVFAWLAWRLAGDEGRLVGGQNVAFALACITRVYYIARRFSWYQRTSRSEPEGD